MKYGFIADLHLNITDSLSPIDSETGFSIRTLDKFDALEKALQKSIEEGCEAFFIMGDTYDKLNPPERLKEAFIRTILPYSKHIKIIIFPGNHDGADFTNNFLSETALFEGVEAAPFEIIHEPTIKYFNNGKDKFLIIPWDVNHQNITDVINETEEGLIFVGHLEIFGAITSTEYQITNGLHPKIFQKFKRVFLGHYHRRQQPSHNILYVGSPIIKDFGEINDPNKGFTIYDSDTDSYKNIGLEFRRGYQYELTPDNLEEVDKEISNNPPEEGSLIELHFHGPKEWVNEYLPGITEIFNSFKPLKIKRKKTLYKKSLENVENILKLKDRIDRIKEISKDEDKELTELGIEIYREAENEFFGEE